MGSSCCVDRPVTEFPAPQSIVPDAQNVTYLSDVEGHWDYFCNWVRLSKGLSWRTPGDHSKARTMPELELELKDGWHFVFGGDTCDKGPGTLRFLQAMVALKRCYPDRVHLLLGNRDINKIRFTSELARSELDRVRDVPGAYWVPEKQRISPLQFLRKLAAEEEGVEEGRVTDAMVARRNTKANKLRYMLKCDMASEGEFEFRRQELAHLNQVAVEDVSDDEVVKSYEASVSFGGCLWEYLNLAQLGVLLGEALFVHGQIIGNQFPRDQVRGADSSNTAWAITSVPDEEEPVMDLRDWIVRLNTWGVRQIREWQTQPTWAVPPRKATYEDWRGRGGAELVAYGTPATRVPTVVYCRFLTEKCMPLQYPPTLAAYLRNSGVRYVVVGHTPHGNAPTVIQNDGVTVIMADTSYSHLDSHARFQGDNRGLAVCDVCIQDLVCYVTGQTEKDNQFVSYSVTPGTSSGDPFVGRLQRGPSTDKRFFVKAKLMDPLGVRQAYLLSNINGFSYEYSVLDSEVLADTLRGAPVGNVCQRRVTSCGDVFGHCFSSSDTSQVLDYIFPRVGLDKFGRVSKGDLLSALADRHLRLVLQHAFPQLDLAVVCRRLARDRYGRISPADFEEMIDQAPVTRTTSVRRVSPGVYFELVRVDDDKTETAIDFPRQLGTFGMARTIGIKPDDLQIYQAELSDWEREGRDCELSLSGSRTAILEQVLRVLPVAIASKPLRGYLSPLYRLQLSKVERQAFNIPDEATFCTWSYPFAADWEPVLSALANATGDPDIGFLCTGAHVYLNKDHRPICMNALVPAVAGVGTLHFGPPQPLPEAWIQQRLQAADFHPVTMHVFIAAGATDFCWIPPSSSQRSVEASSSSTGLGCKLGGFAYIGPTLRWPPA